MHRLASLISTFPSSSTSQNNVSTSLKMYRLASLISIFSQQCQLPKHRFKLREKVSFSVLEFKMFSKVTTSRKSFQLVSEGTIRRPCLNLLSILSNFQTIVSNTVKMHPLASLISKCSHQCQGYIHLFIGPWLY